MSRSWLHLVYAAVRSAMNDCHFEVSNNLATSFPFGTFAARNAGDT